MNFSELHERLRLEILRRIDRGVLTRSLLARQTGFQSAHISNFLLRKRSLSLRALDAVLKAQHLSIADLLPEERSSIRAERAAEMGIVDYDSVPLVTHADAIHAIFISEDAVSTMVKVRGEDLRNLREKCSVRRRIWQRFVAVSITGPQSRPMEPVLQPKSILVIDRHYNSLVAYESARPSIYAIKDGNSLRVRYATFESGRLILRPHNRASPIEAIKIPAGQSLSDFIVGRVCQLTAEL